MGRLGSPEGRRKEVVVTESLYIGERKEWKGKWGRKR